MKNLTKSALTEVGLSPEEKYLASQNVGRSLFSIIQLAKEKELLAKKKQMEESGDIEDSPALQVPIPLELLPQKQAQERSFSIIEKPDGSVEEKINKPNPTSGLNLPSAGQLGLGAGFLTAGVPGALVGGTAAALYDSENPYSTLPGYIKSVKHLDGSIEHVYEPKEEGGVSSFVKKRPGTLLGGAGALALLAGSKKNILAKALLAAPAALTGAVVGNNLLDPAIDKVRKEEILNNPEFQENVKKDVAFLRNKKASDNGLFSNALANLAQHPARSFFGAHEGFKDAKKQYFLKQKAQLALELEEAQKEYLETLQKIKTGADESSTPLVDAFCNGMAYTTVFGKKAEDKDVRIEEGALKRLLTDAVKVKNPASSILQPAADVAVNTAAASAYLTYLIKKKMREEPENYMNEKLPTRVELQPF